MRFVSMNWVIIGSGNGLLPNQHQANTWFNAELLSIALLGIHVSKIRIKIQQFSNKKLYVKMLSAK